VAQDAVEWSDLRVLLALSRAGSMVAAAKSLGVEHTTVGRRIDALERAIGARLVTRTRSGVTLTDAGREAVLAAEDMERAHEALVRRVAQTSAEPEGRVCVSMTDGMVPLVLPFLPAFTARHPRVDLQIQNTAAVVSLEKGEADIGLRLVKPTSNVLVGRRIGEVGWSLYASAEYLARRGRPSSVDALDGHDLVGFDASLARTPGAMWLEPRAQKGRIVVRANTTGALVTLLAAGQGIGIVPCFTATGLVRLTDEVLASNELFAVIHEEQRDVPRVRIVLDYLVEVLTRERERLTGRVCASAP